MEEKLKTFDLSTLEFFEREMIVQIPKFKIATKTRKTWNLAVAARMTERSGKWRDPAEKN